MCFLPVIVHMCAAWECRPCFIWQLTLIYTALCWSLPGIPGFSELLCLFIVSVLKDHRLFFPVHTMYIPLSVVKVKHLRFQKADHFCLKGFSCFHRFSHSTWGLSFQKRKCSQMTAMKGLSSSFRSEHLKELAYLSFLSDTDICWKVWLCTYTWCCSYTWAQIWVSTISYCVSNVLVWILAEWEKLWWLYFLIPHMSLWWGENSFFF